MNKKRLGDILVEDGHLSGEDLKGALAVQQEKAMRLGEILLQNGLVSKELIGKAIEKAQGVVYAPCPPSAIKPETLALLPRSIALRCCALPLQSNGKELIVAMSEPQNLTLLDDLKFSSAMKISPRFSFQDDILQGIKKFYGEEVITDASAAEPTEQEEETDLDLSEMEFITANSREEHREALKELQAGMQQRTPAVRFVTTILAAAAKKGASDIHIQPRIGNTIARIRVDGMLSELVAIPSEYQASVISRIKILADMDIAEHRVPQDGRFLMQYRGNRIDLRVSSLPTQFGEKIVMRLLDPRSTKVELKQLGLSPAKTDALNRILALPQGMLLVTGPTGSGKSTTLYAALNLLCVPHRNIITVEDPVEYMLDGISQVQVNPKAGLTFATCLPSILRQDPDVIMVGEIRDGETARIALEAAQTGHLVLSTLHTNDSIAAIARLVDLGAPSYLVAASVTGVIAQRLVRRLCTCRKMAPATSVYRQRLATIGVNDVASQMVQPVGCPSCENTGYKGRVGIYEMLLVEGPIRDAIHLDARPEAIRSLARSAGFQTMEEDAMEKVEEGLTTLEEVLRVVPFKAAAIAQCDSCMREFAPGFLFCPFCGSPRSKPIPLPSELEVRGEHHGRSIHTL